MLPSYRSGRDTTAQIRSHQPVSAHRPASNLPAVPLYADRAGRSLWNACWEGLEPAEALPTKDREDLVYHLVTAGWTDKQIALHTCMTVYTTVRIRERLGLPANHIEQQRNVA